MQQDESIVCLAGSADPKGRPLTPFSPAACCLLEDLGAELRSVPEAMALADVATFAFWCRHASLARQAAAWADGRTRLGLGLVFHVTPANVPMTFAYSLAFGLLAGNANLVRVPSRPFAQVNLVCAALDRVLRRPEHVEMAGMNGLIRYDRDDAVTAALSARCAGRVIWGGDATVRHLRAMPVPPRCVDVVFADRYSFCVLHAPAVLALGPDGVTRLAQDFCNDVYLMDQNACSSPHLVVWLGPGQEDAKEVFWAAVCGVAERRHPLPVVAAVDTYTWMCRDAMLMENVTRVQRHGSCVSRIGLGTLPTDLPAWRGKWGYFHEWDTDALDNLAPTIDERFQTLSYFGIEPAELAGFVVRNRLSGIDRIVPVGRALDMRTVWDGCDVIARLSRLIDIT